MNLRVRQRITKRSTFASIAITDALGIAGAGLQTVDGSKLYVTRAVIRLQKILASVVYSLNDNTTGVQLLGANGCGTDASGVTISPPPCTGTPSFNTQIRRPDYGIASLIAGGKHVFATRWFDGTFRAGVRGRLRNGDPTRRLTAIWRAVRASSIRPRRKVFTGRSGRRLVTTKRMIQRRWSCREFGPRVEFTAQVNFATDRRDWQRYSIGNHSATIEFGGRFRNAHKFDDSVNTEIDSNGRCCCHNFANAFTKPQLLRRVVSAGTESEV